jgi:hypothetical protein
MTDAQARLCTRDYAGRSWCRTMRPIKAGPAEASLPPHDAGLWREKEAPIGG